MHCTVQQYNTIYQPRWTSYDCTAYSSSIADQKVNIYSQITNNTPAHNITDIAHREYEPADAAAPRAAFPPPS